MLVWLPVSRVGVCAGCAPAPQSASVPSSPSAVPTAARAGRRPTTGRTRTVAIQAAGAAGTGTAIVVLAHVAQAGLPVLAAGVGLVLVLAGAGQIAAVRKRSLGTQAGRRLSDRAIQDRTRSVSRSHQPGRPDLATTTSGTNWTGGIG